MSYIQSWLNIYDLQIYFFRNQSSLITMREKELTIRPTDQLLRTKVNFPWKESYLIDIVAHSCFCICIK